MAIMIVSMVSINHEHDKYTHLSAMTLMSFEFSSFGNLSIECIITFLHANVASSAVK